MDLSADLTALPIDQNARLLSESPLIGRSSHSDIASSDLSVHDLPTRNRSQGQAMNDEHEEDEVEKSPRIEGEDGEEGGDDEEAQIRRARKAARMREEKLQNDLFLLNKLNNSLLLYTDALRATQSSTERLKARLKDTNALLDMYIGTLDRSEAVTRLILDEKWEGASADEEILLNQIREREVAQRREAEAREREAELARLRLEEERVDQSSSGVRGARGTRATMRARSAACNHPPMITTSLCSCWFAVQYINDTRPRLQ
ncbi:hypothetical protein BJ322DRAFT_521350 [Thelephora terrestris]|uniref:DASH complex subunit DUO1 n=1 Tax=Thelephora terrestris TaxID=56493 RepID=A0A9P6L133_9AGAM|nr:hypothetical protein BJ322DRAFT_521350 [Thelephora terrestris]